MKRTADKITDEGLSKPLGYGERRALEQQHKNRDESRGSRAEVERRQGCRTVDMAMKAPRSVKYHGG
jgi:hypothetical protein